MRSDDIRSLDDIARALDADERFGGYQFERPGEGVIEVRVGDAGLTLLDAARYSSAEALEPYLDRSRSGKARVVLLGSEDALHGVADRADAKVVSLAVLPMSRARLALLLPTELDVIALRTKARERRHAADRYRYELSEILAISRALSSERDPDKLLGLILEKSRYITGADAGSIYIVEGMDLPVTQRSLRFRVTQNESLNIDFREFTLPVNDRSIVGKTVLGRTIINIPDLYRLDEPGSNPHQVTHNRELDDKIGYRTRSMLTVPLFTQQEEVIGVIQLINRKRDPKSRLRTPESFDAQVIAFDLRAEELCETLAGQAGVALENALLNEEIQQLFEGFVNASVTAIESRDPTTSGHSQRVATLTCGLAAALDRIDTGPYASLRFTPDDLKQIEYAGLLHDFGKVGVREKVLVKARKLYDHERDRLLLRFDYLRKSIEVESLRRQLDRALRGSLAMPAGGAAELPALDDEARDHLARMDEIVAFILTANEPTVLPSGSFDRISDIARQRYLDTRGEWQPLLLPDEVESLQINRGSLTPAERREIESHVRHTFNFLASIPWGRRFARIPQIAGTHHEKLDGSGYPWGLAAQEIPVEAKMMAISDIFDALTASDRPYKRAVPPALALAILDDEVQAGKCDPELFRVFIEAKVWEAVIRR